MKVVEANAAEAAQVTVVADAGRLVKAPLVSVHMITYNHEPYLGEAIESVVGQQTQYPFELIIGEDCSGDKTREVALSFQRRYPEKVVVLCSGTNVGARANGYRVSRCQRGKYVAFCEGDDYWHNPLKLQQQVSFLETHADHVLVHGAFRIQRGHEIEPGSVQRSGIPTGRVFEMLLQTNFIATCTVCMRRAVVVDYFGSHWSGKDYLMDDYPRWLFASQYGSIGYIDEPLATYRLIPGSAMRRTRDAALRVEMSARQIRSDFAEQYGCSAQALEGTRSRSNRHVLNLATDLADRRTFLEEYRWYRRHDAGWKRDGEMLGRFLLFKLGLFRVARNCRRLLREVAVPQGS